MRAAARIVSCGVRGRRRERDGLVLAQEQDLGRGQAELGVGDRGGQGGVGGCHEDGCGMGVELEGGWGMVGFLGCGSMVVVVVVEFRGRCGRALLEATWLGMGGDRDGDGEG